jgi:methyltransferase-like protein 23
MRAVLDGQAPVALATLCPIHQETSLIPPLPDHPDLAKLPLERMQFPIAGTIWRLDVVRDEAAQLHVTPDRDLYPFGLMVWESAIVLAEVLAELGGSLAGRRVLELGAGVGLPGLVARNAEAIVAQTDHDTLALALARHNAALNRVSGIEQFAGDWNRWTHEPRYHYVVGADIIYDTGNYESLERVFRRNLARGGELILTDPVRQQTIALFTVMEDAGWKIDIEDRTVPALSPNAETGALVDVQVVRARWK